MVASWAYSEAFIVSQGEIRDGNGVVIERFVNEINPDYRKNDPDNDENNPDNEENSPDNEENNPDNEEEIDEITGIV